MDRILVLDDTDSLRDVLCQVIASEGYEVTGAHTAENALEILHSNTFSMAIADLKLPGKSGIDFLKESKNICPNLPIVVMTAYGTIDIAVEAMKYGAVDFMTKPFDPETLCSLISQITKHKRIVDRTFGQSTRRVRKFLTQDPYVEKLLEQARKVAALSSTVLILGESGTGKELIARYIHENSPRISNEFVAVNCASMPSELLESEFFGHEAGSFTGATEARMGLFELADNGTIFLDEIGNMPPHLQTKLLRALQESEIKRLGSTETKKIDVRVIAATNSDIELEILKGNFREDLYYRLSVVVLEIPPLRSRRKDIPLIANFFVKCLCNEFGKKGQKITPKAMRLLQKYDWPGNVRELENIIERAVIMNDGTITDDMLEIPEEKAVIDSNKPQTLPEKIKEAIRSTEIDVILKTLSKTRGNKTKAARHLGISYKTLLCKIKELEIESLR
jgi:DNA-binding NtrC family response regulator